MNDIVRHIDVDATLTPQSARQRGLRWFCDELYRREYDGLNNMNDDLWRMVHDGWKFGQAANPDTNKDAVGVYQPLQYAHLVSL